MGFGHQPHRSGGYWRTTSSVLWGAPCLAWFFSGSTSVCSLGLILFGIARATTVLLHTGSHGRGFHRVANSNQVLPVLAPVGCVGVLTMCPRRCRLDRDVLFGSATHLLSRIGDLTTCLLSYNGMVSSAMPLFVSAGMALFG